jgi:hypothetical protein
VDTNLSEEHAASIFKVKVFTVRMLSPSTSQRLLIQILKEVKMIISKHKTVLSSCYLKTWLAVLNGSFSCGSE